MSSYDKLTTSDTDFIAYNRIEGKANKPTVVFLGGFMSDRNGTKALKLEEFCKDKGLNYIRFDYFGHGDSSGIFEEGTISIWKQNVLDVINQLTTGKLILVGSSMGGWLMFLAALEVPDRIYALIGIASAPDFTKGLIWDKLPKDAQQKIMQGETYSLTSDYGDDPYPISQALIEDGHNHLILNSTIDLNVPVRLIHGLKDVDVPSDLSVELSEKLSSDNVAVTLMPHADHRMSEPPQLALLCETLEDLVEKFV